MAYVDRLVGLLSDLFDEDEESLSSFVSGYIDGKLVLKKAQRESTDFVELARAVVVEWRKRKLIDDDLAETLIEHFHDEDATIGDVFEKVLVDKDFLAKSNKGDDAVDDDDDDDDGGDGGDDWGLDSFG